MSNDQIFVIGLLLGVFSIPAMLSSISEGRAPRVAAFTLIAGGSLVVWAITRTPGGYSLEDIPNAFVRVVADLIR